MAVYTAQDLGQSPFASEPTIDQALQQAAAERAAIAEMSRQRVIDGALRQAQFAASQEARRNAVPILTTPSAAQQRAYYEQLAWEDAKAYAQQTRSRAQSRSQSRRSGRPSAKPKESKPATNGGAVTGTAGTPTAVAEATPAPAPAPTPTPAPSAAPAYVPHYTGNPIPNPMAAQPASTFVPNLVDIDAANEMADGMYIDPNESLLKQAAIGAGLSLGTMALPLIPSLLGGMFPTYTAGEVIIPQAVGQVARTAIGGAARPAISGAMRPAVSGAARTPLPGGPTGMLPSGPTGMLPGGSAGALPPASPSPIPLGVGRIPGPQSYWRNGVTGQFQGSGPNWWMYPNGWF